MINIWLGDGFPFSLPRGAISVSHFSFADDLILFTRATRKSFTALFSFLSEYEEVSGQSINKGKSTFYASKRCSLSQIRVILSLSGIQAGSFPFRYLGCWLFKGRRRVHYFQHLIDSVTKRVSGWMGKLLSFNAVLFLLNMSFHQSLYMCSLPSSLRSLWLMLLRGFSLTFCGVMTRLQSGAFGDHGLVLLGLLLQMG